MKKIKQSNLIITGGERWEDCHAKDLSAKMIRVEMGWATDGMSYWWDGVSSAGENLGEMQTADAK